ncbi:GNAT family N-acetyltransferase [Nonomuraea sp. NPDC005692]|uniref:GNAT family N-acetyltransferase n=1 Tax=Nonomuraea sp. NPDC005692 TaxID=3157168 RepID=UPI0033F8772E
MCGWGASWRRWRPTRGRPRRWGCWPGSPRPPASAGGGLAERVCGWMSSQLVATHGRAALMVDDVNAAAIKVYERIGYRRRLVLACHVAE